MHVRFHLSEAAHFAGSYLRGPDEARAELATRSTVLDLVYSDLQDYLAGPPHPPLLTGLFHCPPADEWGTSGDDICLLVVALRCRGN